MPSRSRTAAARGSRIKRVLYLSLSLSPCCLLRLSRGASIGGFLARNRCAYMCGVHARIQGFPFVRARPRASAPFRGAGYIFRARALVRTELSHKGKWSTTSSTVSRVFPYHPRMWGCPAFLGGRLRLEGFWLRSPVCYLYEDRNDWLNGT